jgi:uncharacterized protein (TIGR03437 family)
MPIRGVFLAILAAAACSAQNGLNYSRIFLSPLGSFSDTSITAMATDPAGNIYLTGWTDEPNLPVTAGVVQPNFAGGACSNGGSPFNPPQTFLCPDAFVIKLDSHGRILFATYLGGSGYDVATSIGLDSAGNIYIAGITAGFPTIANSKFSGGATFIAKLNPTATTLLYTAAIPGTGALPFQMPFGSNIPASNISMTVDSSGNAFFAATSSSGFPVTAKAIETKGGMVAGKLDPSGQRLLYATYFGGSGIDTQGGVTIDSSGNLYITGATSSTDFPVTKGVLQTSVPSGASSAFVAKLNPSGSALAYATYLGGDSLSKGTDIRVDAAGNAYVYGSVGIEDFPVTPGTYQTTPVQGSPPGFLAKINADATSIVYGTYISTGINSVFPGQFDIDPAGNAYITGATEPGFVVSPDALQPCIAAGSNRFVLHLSPAGKFAAATFWGGSNNDSTDVIHVNTDGSVLLAGNSSSSDFLISADSPLIPPGFYVANFQITDPRNAALPCSILVPVNSANFFFRPLRNFISPGELVTFFGLRFGPETGASMQLDSQGNVATELAGVRVLFNGHPAPILYAQSEQINAQVPWELAGQPTANVHVEYNGVPTRTGVAQLQPSAPVLFPALAGSIFGAIINQDGTRNSPSNPAPAGSVVSIFGTGGGATNPPSVTGGIAVKNPLAKLVLPAAVTIDFGLNADVVYAGTVPGFISGLFQINFRIPQSLGAFAYHPVGVNIGTTRDAAFLATK